MSEVFIYVEGPSDQRSMRELFDEVMRECEKMGTVVDFFPLNGKEPLLNKGPTKALNILRNRPNSYVFLVPDLYPPNKPFPHADFQELRKELKARFNREIERKACDERLADRFFVHCFKHDLEALVLASETAFLSRLDKPKFSRSWTRPVENQDSNNPPKRIVEALFRDAGMIYRDVADAPWILKRSSLNELCDKCPQNFKPFAVDIFRLIGRKIS